jgi:hypothetical protein
MTSISQAIEEARRIVRRDTQPHNLSSFTDLVLDQVGNDITCEEEDDEYRAIIRRAWSAGV